MSADPHAPGSDLAQQGVETGAVSAVSNWVDPDEYAVHREQLLSDLSGETFIVDRGVGLDADGGERFEDLHEAAVLRGRIPAHGGVAPRENGDGM
ncbi:hypothetical protein GA0061098_1002242 [Bradyrhizobium shewense]|uniref:Uncharacterized protein n=1 Tax=Bradyrhizobium shewense TaxID=1761772 RepID=A0A1C3UPN3_9BRAD|nr:hypothetical protein GA0061098_1002242 [Bradyrhizobium shewense]